MAASVILAVSAFTASPVTIPLQVSLADWEPQVGDRVLIDTRDNWGYVIHGSGLFVRFPIATGQRRTVRYLGRTYFAATPDGNWEIRSEDIQRDRVTYGSTGRFLRLFEDGETRTSYGIHGHRDAEEMMRSSNRFRSMGCIIVTEPILNLIEETYQLNNGVLAVKTVYGDPF